MKFRSGFLILSLLLAATAANAVVSFEVTNVTVSAGTTDGLTNAEISVSDTVTIDIFVDNIEGDGVSGLGALAFGFDGVVIGFDTGEAASSFFNTKLKFGTLPDGGIGNVEGTDNGTVGSISIPRTLGASSIKPDGAVGFFNGVTTSPAFPGGDGTFDFGVDPAGILDGILTSAGGIHAQLTFSGLSEGTTTISIGTDGINGALIDNLGMQQATSNTTVVITVPEPASAAMGLAAMASVFAVVGLRRRTH